jgi:uncharacterized protein YggE
MRRLLCAAAVAVLLAPAPMALAEAAPTLADSLFHATTLDLSAYGEVRVQPDTAAISLGVSTEAPTAAAAMSANAAQMSRVLAALKAAGIAAKDIQTSNLSLSPKYVYVANQPPTLTGYQASNDVRVRVRDLARLGAAVDATVNAGANQVNGISFELDDRTAAESEARAKAVRALQAKADEYAKATGYRVLRLVSMSEGASVQGPRPIVMTAMRRMAAEAPPAPPVSPGEMDVRVDVSGVYELAR